MRDERIDEEQVEIRQIQVVQPSEFVLLELRRQFVPQIADSAADERETRIDRLWYAWKKRADYLEGITQDPLRSDFEARVYGSDTLQFGDGSARTNHQVGIGSDERKPPQAVRGERAVEPPEMRVPPECRCDFDDRPVGRQGSNGAGRLQTSRIAGGLHGRQATAAHAWRAAISKCKIASASNGPELRCAP